jgi:hypothetical protein
MGDAGMPPHRQVRDGVADIVKIAGPEHIPQRARLVGTRKVMALRGGEHPVEHAETTCDRVDLSLVAGAGEAQDRCRRTDLNRGPTDYELHRG